MGINIIFFLEIAVVESQMMVQSKLVSFPKKSERGVVIVLKSGINSLDVGNYLKEGEEFRIFRRGGNWRMTSTFSGSGLIPS